MIQDQIRAAMSNIEASGHDQSISEGTKATTTVTPSSRALSADLQIASDPALNEDGALAFLKRNDLSAEVIDRLAKNINAVKSRKVRIALVAHPHTPRHISVPLARQLYTFDLMKVGLAPAVAADVKVAVDDVLIARLPAITIGERLTLAHRASGRVAAALLLTGKTASPAVSEIPKKAAGTLDPETRVLKTALENPRLTDALIMSMILRPTASAALVHAVANHAKWSRRVEIQCALLRTQYLSLAKALAFSAEIPQSQLQEILDSSRLPESIKLQVLKQRSRT